MTGLTLLLCAAALGFALAQQLQLPLIPLLILSGIALRITGLNPGPEFLRMALELGVAFLVFTSGIELSPRRFQQRTGTVAAIGVVQFLVVASVGYGCARLLGEPPLTALYLGCALSASSTLVVLRQLRHSRQMFEPFGRLVTGVLLLQDLMMIGIIIVLIRLPGGLPAVAEGVASGTVLFAVAIAMQRWAMPALLRRTNLDEESLLLGMLAILFVFIGVARRLDLPMLAGAFFAGLALSSFPVNGVARGLLNSFATFFMALFFTALGASLSIPDLPTLGRGLLLSGVVIIITPPVVAAIAEWRGMTSRQSIESGLLLAQVSEFAIVLTLAGLIYGQLSAEIFSVVVLVAVITMTLTPFLASERVTDSLLHFHPLRRRIKGRGEWKNHILVLGFGGAGMWVVKPLVASGHNVLVVDDDPIIVGQLEKAKIPCLRGDGSDERTLEMAGARDAKLIVVSMRRVVSAERVLRHVSGVPIVARVFEREDGERIERLGGIPILNSEAAADTFMEWYEKTFQKDKIPTSK